jgi:hypothetical protein
MIKGFLFAVMWVIGFVLFVDLMALKGVWLMIVGWMWGNLVCVSTDGLAKSLTK